MRFCQTPSNVNSENKDKLSEEIVKDIETALADCKKAIEAEDTEDIKKQSEALTQATHKMAESLYKASEAESASADEATDTEAAGGEAKKAATGGGADEEVVDAEFEEADE